MFIYSFITGALKHATMYAWLFFEVESMHLYSYSFVILYKQGIKTLGKMKSTLAGIAHWWAFGL